MGMYCACGAKISSPNFKCKCDWNSWTIIHKGYPPEKPNDLPIGLPKVPGKYLIRWSNDCGDRGEDEWTFLENPILKKWSHGWCNGEDLSWWAEETPIECSVYAWKRL